MPRRFREVLHLSHLNVARFIQGPMHEEFGFQKHSLSTSKAVDLLALKVL
jgi:hypothetical protein